MAGRNIPIDERPGGDDAVITYCYSFEDDAAHADVTALSDGDGLSLAVGALAPEPPALRVIFVFLTVVDDGVGADDGVAADAHFVGTDDLTPA